MNDCPATAAAWPYPFWIAHRGAGRDAPENTLAAFDLGHASGFRMFECDVKLSADAVPFLLHDATLERTTNAQGDAGAWLWEQLAELDAGAWHTPAYAGARLPTLESLAQWCLDRQALLNIEIKPVPGHELRTGHAVALAARLHWAGTPVMACAPPLLTSFQPAALQAAQQAAPELPRGLLLNRLWHGWEDVADTLDCVALVAHYPLIDAALMATAKQRGWHVLAYTVNDEAQARRLMALGVAGLITDRLDLPALVPAQSTPCP